MKLIKFFLFTAACMPFQILEAGNCIETKQPTAFTNCNKEINK